MVTALACIILAAIFFYFRRAVSSESKKAESIAANSTIAEKWRGPLPKDLAQKYISASSHEERLQLVRDPETTAPLLRDFYEKGPGSQEKVMGLRSMGVDRHEANVFNCYEVQLDGGGTRLLYVVMMDDCAYIDFKAYSRFCSTSWSNLLDGTTKEAEEVRVSLKIDRLFVGEFSDEKKWLCYSAQTPDCDEFLYFYAEQESDVAKHLEELKEDVFRKSTLAIRSRNDSHKRKQFEITRYHAASWCD